MNVYKYHPETKEFVGQEEADENPLEQGQYLIPANSTTSQPPSAGDNQIAVFDTGTSTWSLKADYRGIDYYVKATAAKITFAIDESPTEDHTLLVPEAYDIWDESAWVFDNDKWLNNKIRPERNEKLLAVDFTQLGDAPLTSEKKTEWATYRQELRDFPTVADHESLVWPTEPSV